MVSTRRGARTGPVDDPVASEDAGTSQRKTYRRKATTKADNQDESNTQAPSITESTAASSGSVRMTRATAAAIASQGTAPSQSTISQETPTETTKPRFAAKSGHGTISRKEEASSQSTTQSEHAESASPARKSTRQLRKVTQPSEHGHVDETEPPLQPDASIERNTRAPKPAIQPPPLKKTRQASIRSTRTASQPKRLEKAAQDEKQEIPERSNTRKAKTKSDKDASKVQENTIGDDFAVHAVVASTPAWTRHTKARIQENTSPGSDLSMSTRSTTPSDSPMFVFTQPKDYIEDKQDSADIVSSNDEADEDEEQPLKYAHVDSEDELAGPKTPMRRANVRRAAQTTNVEPVEPLVKPASPIQQAQVSQEDQMQDEDALESITDACVAPNEALKQQELFEESIVVLDELSMLVPSNDAPDDQSPPAGLIEGAEVYTGNKHVVFDSFVLQPLPKAFPVTATMDYATTMASLDPLEPSMDASISVLPAETQGADADETIVIEESHDPASPDSDHSVIITRLDDSSEDSDIDNTQDHEVDDNDEDDYTRLSLTATAKTPRPQTIDWDSIQPNTVVRANLGMPVSPQVDLSQLGAMPDVVLSSPTKREIAAAVAQTAQEAEDEQVEFTEFVTLPGPEIAVKIFDELEAASSTSAVPDQAFHTPALEEDVFLEHGQDMTSEQIASYDATTFIQSEKLNEEHSETTNDIEERSGTVMTNEEQIAGLPDHGLNQNDRTLVQEIVQPKMHEHEADESQAGVVSTEEQNLPHYMQSTIASDARRNSLPTNSLATPVKSGSRPSTSDGASLWRAARPFEEPWWAKSRNTPKPATPAAITNAAPVAARRSLAPFAASTPRSTRLAPSSADSDRPVTPEDVGSRISRRVHAKTVAVPSRFHVMTMSPPKRLGTSTTRDALRKIAIKNGTPIKTRSPARTPLRSLMGTPGFTTMTPHPTIPLRGVVAIVEVFTLEGASASAPFVALLHRLGAKTTKIWGDRVTHVVFKDGSPSTLQRVYLSNKTVAQTRTGTHIHCVNSRWVSDCDAQAAHVSELDEAYAVSVGDFKHSSKRKRKSMEPSTVVHVDGSLVKSRKNSWGRTASGRFLGSPITGNLPAGIEARASQSSTDLSIINKENASRDSSTSPATRAWFAAPDKLVQATAPLKRVRRLEPAGLDRTKARRRTMWNNE